MATKIGSIFADFTARTAGFQKGLEEVQAGMKKTRKVVDSNAASIKSGLSQINSALGTIGIGISTGAIINGLKAVGQQILDIKDGATELGTSFKDFQILQTAAEYSSEAMGVLTSALNKLETNLQKARNEGGATAKTFRDMGVSISSLQSMSAGQRFAYIAQDIKKAIDPSARFAEWAELLGAKALPKLKEALDNASVGYDALAKKTAQTGYITDDTIKKYDEVVKRWDRGKKIMVAGIANLVEEMSLRKDIMGGHLDEVADKLQTNQEKVELYMRAMSVMEKSGGWTKEQIQSIEDLAVKYNLLASEERFQAQQAENATNANAKQVGTLGDTKDAVSELGKSYGDTSDHLRALWDLFNTVLPRGTESTRVLQDAIDATTAAITKDTERIADSLKTPYEKYLEIVKELEKRKADGIPGAAEVLEAYKKTNPEIKATIESTDKLNQLWASVDEAKAYELGISEINKQIRDLATNSNIATSELVDLEAKLKKQLYEKTNSKAMGKAEDIRKFIQTPAQSKASEVSDINANKFLSDTEKKTAIAEVNDGFVTMRNNMIASADELKNNTELWGGLRDAAAKASTQFEAATTVGELKKVQAGLDQTQSRYAELQYVGNMAIEGLASGFAKLIVEGGSVKDMLGSLVKMIAETMIQMAIIHAIKSTGIFGGMYAGGGDVNPNKLYVVGENGPELFSPKARGTIINQDQIAAKTSGGNNAPVIQFNLSAYDTTGMSQMIDQKTPGIVAQAMNRWRYENSRGKF